MEDKIAELTEKLYHEGVEMGEARARELIADAEAEARHIVADAEARATEIIDQAKTSAEQTRRNVDAEIRLSVLQALGSFKQQLQDSVLARVVDDAVTRSLSDADTVADLIKTSIQGWNTSAGQAPELLCLLPESKRMELERALNKAICGVLAEGVELRYSDALNAGFRVGPKDGGFAVSFTDEDFREFFKDYARPRTRKYLFGE